MAAIEDDDEPVAKKRKEDNDDKDCDKEESADKITEIKRLNKKKCILIMSYCGKGYMGMQRNPGVPTIEEALMQALWKAGAIPENHRDNLGKLHFQRCARTDKGVSAARQVVSLKIPPDPNIVPIINDNLPRQIRIMGLKKVTKSFNSKTACTSRVYEYLMPTYAYAPFEETNVAYRITSDVLSKIQSLLDQYHGTHNFHNFTSGKKHDEPSAKRFIMSFSIGSPFVYKNIEFVSLSVEGQSFMLHQIRKMIGLVIGIVRGYLDENTIQQSFNPPKLDIPRAPAVGLFLDNVKYLHYNRRLGNDGIHEPLEWDEYEDSVSHFKEEYIHQHIVDTELREHTMLQWLQTLQLHDFHKTDSKIVEKTQVISEDVDSSKTQIEHNIETEH
jgi:tRNA pseudouridine38-40 synthase